MKLKRSLCILLMCIIVADCLPVTVDASDVPSRDIIWLEDLEWEWIDLSEVGHPEDVVAPRANVQTNESYSAYSISAVTQSIDLKVDDLITFNCSYSPSSASMDFGVIASNGRFYYINVKEGSINQIIKISQSGSYTVAIRNNSSQTVSVVGFVNY